LGRFAHPQAGDREFDLKLRLIENAEPENIWLDHLRTRGGQLMGNIANTPVALSTYHYGDSLVIDTSAVSDWLLVSHDTMYGGYTLHLTRSRYDSAARARDAADRDYVIPDTPRP
jgi:uncharacterized protein YegJ (DUF2314 family)